MKSVALDIRWLALGATTALLVGCGYAQPNNTLVPSRLAARTAATSAAYQQLYSFHPRWHGVHPDAGLTLVNGVLYGTSERGGALGRGTVYSVTTHGVEKVLYAFHGGADGSSPTSGLLDMKGTLYGTTYDGGSSNDGTVYSISTSGAEKVLYSFAGGTDGANPRAGLVALNGILYGTTLQGGGGSCSPSCGTVFSITPSGNESVLHRFTGGSDGEVPLGGLLVVKGLLYGTTAAGGKSYSTCYGGNADGCGTVYTLTPAGVKKVIYDFRSGSDGSSPESSLTVLNGTLYGTTSSGGQQGSNCGQSCGVVYAVTTKGVEKVLHRFADGSDGALPYAGLIPVNGTLYGTTSEGGDGGSCFIGGGNCGTVYSITTSGTETVLYRFAGGADGFLPVAPLVDVDGTLYGTTQDGGYHDQCCAVYGFGTVFTLSLSSK
jgi:uncharacterized repeat protein (TIGR03803 family)